MYRGYPQTLSLSCKSSLFDYSASSSSSRPTLLPAAMGHTSFPLLVHRLAKPRADSLVSYAFRLIWICVVVFQLRIYYYLFTQSFRNESHPIFWCVSFHEVFAFLRCLNRPFALDDHVINFVKTRRQFAFEFHESLKISKFTRIPMENHSGVTRWQKFSYKSF